MKIYFTKLAMVSWRTLDIGDWFSIHILPHKYHKRWWFQRDWYDGPLYSFGLGPLVLVCWAIGRK